MPDLVHVERLNRAGDRPVDLEQCERFRVCEDEQETLTYYRTPEGDWLVHRSDCHEGFWQATYREVHPVEVAHELLAGRFTLPADLEPYREVAADRQKYREWFAGRLSVPIVQQKPKSPPADPAEAEVWVSCARAREIASRLGWKMSEATLSKNRKAFRTRPTQGRESGKLMIELGEFVRWIEPRLQKRQPRLPAPALTIARRARA